MYVCDTSQHKPEKRVLGCIHSMILQDCALPRGAKEVNNSGVGPGHGLGHPLVGQLPAGVQIKHLQVTVLSNSDGHIGLLLVEGSAVHGYAGLIRLQGDEGHMSFFVCFPP